MKSIFMSILVLFIVHSYSYSQRPLKLVTSVRQKGPVAYRDPFGAISPDGRLFAYSDLRKIVVQPINGGAVMELQKNGAFIRYLTWTPDSKNS